MLKRLFRGRIRADVGGEQQRATPPPSALPGRPLRLADDAAHLATTPLLVDDLPDCWAWAGWWHNADSEGALVVPWADRHQAQTVAQRWRPVGQVRVLEGEDAAAALHAQVAHRREMARATATQLPLVFAD